MADSPDFVPIHNDGDLIPLNEFIDCCKMHAFIDYDGMGNLATETHVEKGDESDPKWIYPSQIVKGTVQAPEWVTHVLWYNR